MYVDCEPWGWLTAPEVHLSLLEELSEALDAGAAGQLALPSAPLSYRAFERAIRDVARRGLYITLLLDEFEALGANPHLDADFFSGLRALATRHAISFVTASATPLLELTYTNRGVLSSPFFNFFAQLRLRLFSRTEAEALLSAPAPSTGVPSTHEPSTSCWRWPARTLSCCRSPRITPGSCSPGVTAHWMGTTTPICAGCSSPKPKPTGVTSGARSPPRTSGRWCCCRSPRGPILPLCPAG